MSNNAASDPYLPCKAESTMWRECLKIYDYGPEKPEKECEKERGRYYSCVKEWRVKETGQTAPAGKEFMIGRDCSGLAQSLHNCMMINMFETGKCQKEMLELRICTAKHDKSVAATLEEDVKNGWVTLPKKNANPEDSTGITRIWYKLIGKI